MQPNRLKPEGVIDGPALARHILQHPYFLAELTDFLELYAWIALEVNRKHSAASARFGRSMGAPEKRTAGSR